MRIGKAFSKIVLFAALSICAASSALAAVPIGEEEEKAFVSSISTAMGVDVSVWRARVEQVSREWWDGTVSKVPVVTGTPDSLRLEKYPDAPLLGVFLEFDRKNSKCHIIIVEDNVEKTMNSIVRPVSKMANMPESDVWKSIIVHEVAHCAEYRAATSDKQPSLSPGLSARALLPFGKASTEDTVRKEVFADLVSALWAKNVAGYEAFPDALAAVRQKRAASPSHRDHETSDFLAKLRQVSVKPGTNLCKIANSVRDEAANPEAFSHCDGLVSTMPPSPR